MIDKSEDFEIFRVALNSQLNSHYHPCIKCFPNNVGHSITDRLTDIVNYTLVANC